MYKLGITLAFILAILQHTSAVCNVCNSNGVACINEKDFHICHQGVVDTMSTFSCMGTKVCTQNGPICMEKTSSSVAPACGDTSNCGKCADEEDDGKFTCTSRTTFTMCFDSKLSEIRESCPINKMCDVRLAKQGQYPCVPSCMESEMEFCDLYDAMDGPVITTTEPPTTTTELDTTTKTNEEPTTEPQLSTNAQENIDTTTDQVTTTTVFSPTPPPVIITTQSPVDAVCSQQSAVGRYPHPNDPKCKNYIYCSRQGGKLRSVVMECPAGQYFRPSIRMCGNVKPAGCA